MKLQIIGIYLLLGSSALFGMKQVIPTERKLTNKELCEKIKQKKAARGIDDQTTQKMKFDPILNIIQQYDRKSNIENITKVLEQVNNLCVECKYNAISDPKKELEQRLVAQKLMQEGFYSLNSVKSTLEESMHYIMKDAQLYKKLTHLAQTNKNLRVQLSRLKNFCNPSQEIDPVNSSDPLFKMVAENIDDVGAATRHINDINDTFFLYSKLIKSSQNQTDNNAQFPHLSLLKSEELSYLQSMSTILLDDRVYGKLLDHAVVNPHMQIALGRLYMTCEEHKDTLQLQQDQIDVYATNAQLFFTKASQVNDLDELERLIIAQYTNQEISDKECSAILNKKAGEIISCQTIPYYYSNAYVSCCYINDLKPTNNNMCVKAGSLSLLALDGYNHTMKQQFKSYDKFQQFLDVIYQQAYNNPQAKEALPFLATSYYKQQQYTRSHDLCTRYLDLYAAQSFPKTFVYKLAAERAHWYLATQYLFGLGIDKNTPDALKHLKELPCDYDLLERWTTDELKRKLATYVKEAVEGEKSKDNIVLTIQATLANVVANIATNLDESQKRFYLQWSADSGCFQSLMQICLKQCNDDNAPDRLNNIIKYYRTDDNIFKKDNPEVDKNIIDFHAQQGIFIAHYANLEKIASNCTDITGCVKAIEDYANQFKHDSYLKQQQKHFNLNIPMNRSQADNKDLFNKIQASLIDLAEAGHIGAQLLLSQFYLQILPESGKLKKLGDCECVNSAIKYLSKACNNPLHRDSLGYLKEYIGSLYTLSSEYYVSAITALPESLSEDQLNKKIRDHYEAALVRAYQGYHSYGNQDCQVNFGILSMMVQDKSKFINDAYSRITKQKEKNTINVMKEGTSLVLAAISASNDPLFKGKAFQRLASVQTDEKEMMMYAIDAFEQGIYEDTEWLFDHGQQQVILAKLGQQNLPSGDRKEILAHMNAWYKKNNDKTAQACDFFEHIMQENQDPGKLHKELVPIYLKMASRNSNDRFSYYKKCLVKKIKGYSLLQTLPTDDLLVLKSEFIKKPNKKSKKKKKNKYDKKEIIDVINYTLGIRAFESGDYEAAKQLLSDQTSEIKSGQAFIAYMNRQNEAVQALQENLILEYLNLGANEISDGIYNAQRLYDYFTKALDYGLDGNCMNKHINKTFFVMICNIRNNADIMKKNNPETYDKLWDLINSMDSEHERKT